MANFCRNCGKPLEDGKACDCMAQQAPQPQQPQEQVVQPQQQYAQPVMGQPAPQAAGVDIQGVAVKIWNLFKALIKNPVSAGAQAVSSCDFKSALIIMGVQAIATALFVISMLGKYNALATSQGSVSSEYLCPIFQGFLVSAVSAFGIACLLAAVLLMFVKIFKGNTNYKYMLCVSSIKSLICVPFILAGVLASLILPINATSIITNGVNGILIPILLPVLLATVGGTLGDFVMLNIIGAGSDTTTDKAPYVLFLTVIVMAVALYVVMNNIAMPMCLPPAVKDAVSSFGGLMDSVF